MFCPASDPRPSRPGRSRHRWSYRLSVSARTSRAGRTRRPRAHLRVEIRGKNEPTNRTQISSCASHVFPVETLRSQTRIQTAHHRDSDAGAVLGVVNALRCASTRPAAGPAGIDDASARHVRQLRDGQQSVDYSKRVDAVIAQAYVGIITSVPHGTPSVRRHGQRSAHPADAHTARHRAHPQTSQTDARRSESGSSARLLKLRTSEHLAAHHPQDHALRRERVHQWRCIALV